MELDPRLSSLTSVDLDYQFAPETGFDPSYPVGVYSHGHGHGLNNEQQVPAHPHTHPHPQPHFVQDAAGMYYSAAAHQHPSTSRRRTNGTSTRAPSQYPTNSVNIAPNTTNVQSHQVGTHQGQYMVHTARRTPQATIVRYGNSGNSYVPTTQIQQTPVRSSPVNAKHSTPSNNSPLPTPQPIAISTPTAKSNTNSLPNPIAATPTPNKATTVDLSTFTHPSNFPLVSNPPDLAAWRARFFNITSPIILTSEEYHTYFPHVDNIYSHRSTQKYKKKPFVSHYWDCRLKGRPTGTPLGKPKKEKTTTGDLDISGDINQDDGGAQDGNEEGDKTNGTGGAGNKKRKRKVRERDLCDVKIKVTEYFGRDELEALGRLGEIDEDIGIIGGGENLVLGDSTNGLGGGMLSSGNNNTTSSGTTTGSINANRNLYFVHEDGTPAISTTTPTTASIRDVTTNTTTTGTSNVGGDSSSTFGVLEPLKKFPAGHPGSEGKRWYMVQRVNGTGKDGETVEGQDLSHKHTLDESDRIKKNSVQRWLIAQEKEKKKQAQRSKNPTTATESNESSSRPVTSSSHSFHASGEAKQTAKAHSAPASTQLTLYANSFCPFAQRIWIALELKGIPYQYWEVSPSQIQDGKCTIPSLLEVCPEGTVPCIRHGNFGVWESTIMMEYLEDLSMGHSLLPLGNPQLRAHCRLWTDHINRKIVPSFYMLLMLPSVSVPEITDDGSVSNGNTETRSALINTVQAGITELVNASHATGPFFCGSSMSFVDVAFAPWIIRLSRVLSYYRDFPRPEVGTRWSAWVDAIEQQDAIKRTVSDQRSYHNVYGGVGKDAKTPASNVKGIAEMKYAQSVVQQSGFGLGGDELARMRKEEHL